MYLENWYYEIFVISVTIRINQYTDDMFKLKELGIFFVCVIIYQYTYV